MNISRIKIATVTAVALQLVFVTAVHSNSTAKPNVVFILADDMGVGDVKCFGQKRCLIDTPHMDALARRGMMFTDAHSVAAVCVPSRVAIMTGRYPWRSTGTRPSGPWGFLNPRLKTSAYTLGRMLKTAGYRTGYVGKWHLGTLMATRDGNNQNSTNVDYLKPLKVGPAQFGFDTTFILPGSLDMYPYAFVKDGRWVGQVTAQKGWSAFNRVGPAAEDFEDVKVLDTFSRQAESFIAQHAAAARGGRPFFLYVALTSPHTPISPRAEFEGKSRLGLYGDFVMETDDCVGRVVQALDRHGLTDNTLFIATSDHGAASYAGNIRKATAGQIRTLEAKGHYPSGIYRGYKFSIYEGGNRIPLVARWPGVVPAGTTCRQLIGLNDLMATLAEVLEVDLQPDQAPDSISYLPLLKNPAAPAPRRNMILQSTSVFAVRHNRWKLCVCPGSGASGKHGNVPSSADAWKKAVSTFGRAPTIKDLRDPAFVQLFDLANDPTESNNLATKRPELVKQIFAILDKQIATGRSTAGGNQKNDVPRINIHNRVPGFVFKKLAE